MSEFTWMQAAGAGLKNGSSTWKLLGFEDDRRSVTAQWLRTCSLRRMKGGGGK